MGKARPAIFSAAVLSVLFSAAERAAAPSISGLSCSIQTTNLVSVTIGNVNKAPVMNNTLRFSCESRRLADPAYSDVVYCWHIHDAPGGTARFTYRYATKDGNNKIGFNIYSQGKKVGDRRTDYNIFGYAKRVSNTVFQVDDPITIRFEGNQGTSPAWGQYTYNNPQTHVVMHYLRQGRDSLSEETACGARNGDVAGTGNTKGQTNITINVRTYCNIRVDQDIEFPAQTVLDKKLTAPARVNTDCSAGTDYQVTIGKGNNYKDGMRHMSYSSRGKKGEIAYSVSPEIWTGTGNGTGDGETTPIEGTVLPQPTPPAGVYRDSLVVSVQVIR